MNLLKKKIFEEKKKNKDSVIKNNNLEEQVKNTKYEVEALNKK
jgi:hypothetical protein